MNTKSCKFFIALGLVTAMLLTSTSAQDNTGKPDQAPTASKVVNLWPGVAPGSEEWKQTETVLGSGNNRRIVNVTTPTLTVYAPAATKVNGTAVIIAPGGAFVALSIDSDGYDVAKWLVDRGFVAIVLKYRTVPLEGENETQLAQSAGARFGAQLRNLDSIAEDGKYGIADGIQGIKVVRAHAAEWGLAPDRIVFTGFSAGGMIAAYTAMQTEGRPNYVAPIYGAPVPTLPPIPQGLPPFFMAMAQDDALAGAYIIQFYDALKAAGYRPEFHIYNSGVTVGACANKANRATTGSTSFISGWRHSA